MTYKGDRGIYGQDSSWLTPAPPITVPRRDKEEKRKTDRAGTCTATALYTVGIPTFQIPIHVHVPKGRLSDGMVTQE